MDELLDCLKMTFQRRSEDLPLQATDDDMLKF